MAEIKDKVITAESLKTKHDYDESTYLKKSGALNTLGITATAKELNILDGVTATASEINKLDGLTATTKELNYVDGVTSNIQTQLNNKHTIGNNVTVDKESSPYVEFKVNGVEATKIYKNASSTADYGTTMCDYDSTGERDAFIVRRGIALKNKLSLKVQNGDGTDDVYYIYGEHNKPTAYDVGALSTSGGTINGGVTINSNMTLNGNATIRNIYLSENGVNKGVILAKNPSGNYVNNLQPCNENGNCVIGWGNYERKNGDTNIYGDNVHIYALNSDGTIPSGAVFVGRNENNHTLINNAAHVDMSKRSDTYIYGSSVHVDTNNTDFLVDGIQLAHGDETTCSLASGWAQFYDGGKLYASRYGKVVTVTGSLKNTKNIESSGSKIKMFTVPAGYRPARNVNVVCQGAGVMTWLLTIESGGDAYMSRHGATAYTDVEANDGYFAITATYVSNG